ncbi:Hypothetical protein, putative [Bodo saltans]|uniref:Uncharacterized protein n=1 Tax=Bodo saltans TaxID=75058 RepID=A0A0S4J3H0_BODSA|nr:Hypothetical protein, putative [Bodo saltans]|eukprot:CUG85937.1 Hypothetical protein, putative [Bodo saltans]
MVEGCCTLVPWNSLVNVISEATASVCLVFSADPQSILSGVHLAVIDSSISASEGLLIYLFSLAMKNTSVLIDGINCDIPNTAIRFSHLDPPTTAVSL